MVNNSNNIEDDGSLLLTSKMLHSLRNNLNSILGYSEILQDNDFFSDEEKKMLDSIVNASINIKSLLSHKKETIEKKEIVTAFTNSTQKESNTINKYKFKQHSKILIVDDRPENLLLFTEILTPYNYDLNVATSGIEALKIVKNFNPELILLDVVMPEMNGYEVLKELKKSKSTREIPVIFLTAKDTTDDIVKGFEEGAVDYIAKPFHPKELIARVHTHLQKARIFANLKRLMEHSFHELYTPLSIISSSMQIQELEHERTDYTQMTLAACKTLQNIYDDLYYSINYSNIHKIKTIFDFKALLLQRINYFSLVAKSRSLKFNTNLPNQMLLLLNYGDIERVVDNLISNSIKYTKENGEISISLTLTEDKNVWKFLICNPVSKEIDIEKIFQKYYRQEEEVFGLGLGLELVQAICRENDIKICATAKHGLFCIEMELLQTK